MIVEFAVRDVYMYFWMLAAQSAGRFMSGLNELPRGCGLRLARVIEGMV
jgi:hypothetical protein